MESKKLENVFVVFLDVLGQRSKLRKIREVPSTGDEEVRVQKIVDETMGTTLAYRGIRDRFMSNVLEPKKAADGTHQFLADLIQSPPEIVSYNLSDALVFATPIFREGGPTHSLKSIFHILIESCNLMAHSLANGFPLRGGIEVAPGILDGNEVFGPALAKAYEIETHSAEYPRVVVGNNAFQLLTAAADQDDVDDPEKKMMSGIAGACLTLITQDTDGRKMLDPFGKGVFALREDKEFQQRLNQAIAFAIREEKIHKSEGEEKLQARYYRLSAYLEKSLGFLVGS